MKHCENLIEFMEAMLNMIDPGIYNTDSEDYEVLYEHTNDLKIFAKYSLPNGIFNSLTDEDFRNMTEILMKQIKISNSL